MSRPERLDCIGHTRIRPSRREQPLVVQRQKAIERARRVGIAACRQERALDEDGSAVTDHPRDGLVRERRGAELGQERVGRVGKIVMRVDERAIEIKNDERNHSLQS
jgi:hypothetical protein